MAAYKIGARDIPDDIGRLESCAPREVPAAGTSHGVFPLCFGGQAAAAFLAVRLCIEPTDSMHWMIVVVRAAVFSLRDFINVDPECLVEANFGDGTLICVPIIAAHLEAARRH